MSVEYGMKESSSFAVGNVLRFFNRDGFEAVGIVTQINSDGKLTLETTNGCTFIRRPDEIDALL